MRVVCVVLLVVLSHISCSGLGDALSADAVRSPLEPVDNILTTRELRAVLVGDKYYFVCPCGSRILIGEVASERGGIRCVCVPESGFCVLVVV